jgi:Zn finger protein HypA/HybF involved in hydrogenase expression
MIISDSQLEEAVKSNFSVRSVVKHLGLKLAGGTQTHISKRIKKLGLDTSHFLGKSSNKGKNSPIKKSFKEILIKRVDGGRCPHRLLKHSLVEYGVKYECQKCQQGPIWLGHPLTLDVDHINEDWLDDRVENLRFLCPNCHSQFSRKLLGD